MAAAGIVTTGVALGRVGGDGLSVAVANDAEGGPAAVSVAVTEQGTDETAASETLSVGPRGREQTTVPATAGRYTVAVTVDGDAVGAVDLSLGRTPTGRLTGPGVAVHLAPDGSRTLGLT